MSINNKLLSCIVLLLFSFQGYAQIHVDLSATGSNNGTSWTDAYTDLQVAINAAAPGDKIWVAQGIYLPTISPSGSSDPRTMSFYMNQDILIYGGFDASTGLRNPAVYITTLSGDIGVTGNNFDNSYHVFITASLTSSAVIDGFTIQDGNADAGGGNVISWSGYVFRNWWGGGFCNESSSPTLIDITVSNNSASDGGGFFNNSSSPTLTNVLVSNNSASTYGGGFFNLDNSSPTLTNVTVSNNSAYHGSGFFNDHSSPTLTNVTVSNNSTNSPLFGHGGGFYNSYSSPTLTNVTVSNNSADNGGGFHNDNYSSPTLTNVTVSNNSASSYGGGFRNLQNSSPTLTNVLVSNNSAGTGGGFYNGYSSSPTLTNVLVSNNSAVNGGGFYNENYSSPTLTNVTVSNNSALNNGRAFYNDNSSPVIQNSIIWDIFPAFSVINITSSPTYYYSLIKGSGGSGTWNTIFGTDGGNNIDINPMFTNPSSDFTLQLGSPAINKGNNSFNTTTTDLAGNTRIASGTIDMGAFEDFINPTGLIYVNLSATGSNNGTSWTDAYTDLQVAINAAAPGNQIWVAQGTYLPTISPSGSPDPRTMSFYMNQDILIYGGFNGTETSLSQRNYTLNITTLSGDIGVTGSNFDNSYHVFMTKSLTSSALIDGFTIQDGNADGTDSISWIGSNFYNYYGGGFYNESSSPTLINITVSNNSSVVHGGGFYNKSSASTLVNVTVSNNSATNGGGFYTESSSPTLVNVTVSNNLATNGGGFYNKFSWSILFNITVSNNSAENGGGFYYNSSSLKLIDATIDNNSASNDGGGFYINNRYSTNYNFYPSLTNVTINNNSAINGGGFYNDNSDLILTNVTVSNNLATNGGGFYNGYYSSQTLTNVTVSNNSASNNGGGFYNDGASPTLSNVLVSNNSATNGGGFYNNYSYSTLTNVTVSNNSASNDGGGFYNDNYSSPNIFNSIIWNNSPSVTNIGYPAYYYSLIEGSGGSGGTWNTTFGTDGGNNIDMNPMFTNPGIDDFTLQSGSPAINTGDNSLNTTLFDLAGNTRIESGTIDMGAYEHCPIVINSSVTNVSCFGGSNGTIVLTITTGCGTPPYTYSWSNGSTSQNLSGLSTGTYTVTVTDINGLTSTHTAIVTQPAAALEIAHTATKSCSGQSNGTITLTVTGGTSTYTYSWNDGSTLQNRTGLAPGIYKVKVTDANGCTKIKYITILSSTPLVVTPTIINVSCFGGTNGKINLTVTGGTSPYTYAWGGSSNTSKIRSSLTAGTYPITVTDANGCTMSSTITVTQPSQLIVTTLATNTTGGLNNGSIALTVTGGTSPYTYLWNTTPPATTPTITGLGINTYRVTVTDANGCKKIISKRVNRPAGNGNETEELFEEQLTNLYPNPAKTSFNLEFDNIDKGDVQVEVFTALGTRIYSNTTNLSLLNISTENWEAGFYYVRVMQGDYSQTLKVVVQP